MRVMHIADCHLGYRAYLTRVNAHGINQREADVAQTFSRVIDLVIGRAPELVIIAGDVFHVVRPTNTSLRHAVREFRRLRTALPNTIVVMVAGNHDTPHASDAGCILPLIGDVTGIHVADYAPRRFAFPDRELSVLAVPDAGHARPEFTPDTGATWNVCVAHLEVAGMLKGAAGDGRKAIEVSLDELAAERFDYVGCGHYHVYRSLGANAAYAGSIDYTSSDIWGELREANANPNLKSKAILERDLETGQQIIHHLPPSRLVLDLPVIEADGMSVVDLDCAIQEHAESIEIAGAIVRQVVTGCDAVMAKDLDYRAIRRYESGALHYQLDRKKVAPKKSAPLPKGPRLSIDAMLTDRLTTRAAELSASEPEVAALLVSSGIEVLQQATAMESDKQREPEIAADVAA